MDKDKERTPDRELKCEYCANGKALGDNFCIKCGTKLSDECWPCWVKKKPYRCNMAQCPGYGLFVDEAAKIRADLGK